MFARGRRPVLAWLMFAGIAVSGGTTSLAEPPPRLQFTRMLTHWGDCADPGYIPFVVDCKAEVAQVGFYGAHFWSLAHTAQFGGYPAHFPVRGLKECGGFFENLNRQLHEHHVKVIGHFNVKFLVGDPKGPDGEPRGFFKFYRDLWDVEMLGPKPVDDGVELLEKNADGSPIESNSYNIGGMKEYWGCLNNPHWRAVLKAWMKVGVKRGVDGFISNYFYRNNCLCNYCQAAFRKYLSERFSAAELKVRFGIDDLASYKFTEIVGWHDPTQSTPLKREMLRFSQIANKEAYDEVFIEYGRSLKPDLIVAQWDHIGDFNQINGDERCMLPAELWGRGEDYLWYSTGGAANYTDLKTGWLGEGTLQARYIRGAFDGKPFTLGKYESTRIRVAIAELAANGGAAMGFYTNFKDGAARAEIVRYYNFLAKYDRLYRGATPAGEVLLLYPRNAVHNGDVAAVDSFKYLGRELLDRFALFDVLPDDLATPQQLASYKHVIRATSQPTTQPALPPLDGITVFNAPAHVRVSASRSADGKSLVLHFVNYNRTEPEKPRSPGTGIKDEQPIAAGEITVDLVMKETPKEFVTMTPEEPESMRLESAASNGGVRIRVPGFLVYRVVELR